MPNFGRSGYPPCKLIPKPPPPVDWRGPGKRVRAVRLRAVAAVRAVLLPGTHDAGLRSSCLAARAWTLRSRSPFQVAARRSQVREKDIGCAGRSANRAESAGAISFQMAPIASQQISASVLGGQTGDARGKKLTAIFSSSALSKRMTSNRHSNAACHSCNGAWGANGPGRRSPTINRLRPIARSSHPAKDQRLDLVIETAGESSRSFALSCRVCNLGGT